MARVSRSKTSESPYRVQVLDRAMAALEVLGARPQERSLVELCNALKLHKSTVHRLMMVLEQHRLVDKNPDTGRYRLGLKLFEFGSKAIGALDLKRHAKPHLTRLLQEINETVHFYGCGSEQHHPTLGAEAHYEEHHLHGRETQGGTSRR